jgi:hypothetical protein
MVTINKESLESHDFNRAQADHDRSNWRHTVYLQENGEVDVFTMYGNGQPMTAFHQRDLYLVGVPDGVAEVSALVAKLESLEPRLKAVHEGHEVEFDGSNLSGRLTEFASEALDDLRIELERWVNDATTYGDLPRYWRAGDWIQQVDSEIVRLAHRADRGDAIQEIVEQALWDDVYLDKDDLDRELDWIKKTYCHICYEKGCECHGVSREQLEALACEAAEADDNQTFHDCYLALQGDSDARERCAEVVSDAKAMED